MERLLEFGHDHVRPGLLLTNGFINSGINMLLKGLLGTARPSHRRLDKLAFEEYDARLQLFDGAVRRAAKFFLAVGGRIPCCFFSET